MKNLMNFAFLIITITLFSCAATSPDQSKQIGVSGQISDAAMMKVFLDRTGANNTMKVVNQTETDEKGNFSLDFGEDGIEPGLYRVRIGAKRTILVMEGETDGIEINGNLNSLGNYSYSIKGSDSADDFAKMMKSLNKKKVDVTDIEKYIQNTKFPFAGMQLALTSLGNRPDFWATHKIAAEKLTASYPNDETAKSYLAFTKELQQAYVAQQAKELIKIGAQAPDIALTSPEGKEYRLSDLKGKVVLIDFWASWCGPCRKNNPHVVDVYKRYKKKGFTVYSVSLDGLDAGTRARYGDPEKIKSAVDRSKESWIKAIKKDNLTWDYHVSELAKWDTKAAKQYGVRGIPKTFLLDREGKIVAVNPRYDLEDQVKKVI